MRTVYGYNNYVNIPCMHASRVVHGLILLIAGPTQIARSNCSSRIVQLYLACLGDVIISCSRFVRGAFHDIVILIVFARRVFKWYL